MKIKTMLCLVLSLVSMLLSGCTTVGKPYAAPPSPAEGKALVHFMRSSVGYGNFWTTIFSVNDVEVVSLYDKGYSWIHLDAGTYDFSAKSSLGAKLHFTMPVYAGNTYYVEFTQESAGYNRYRNIVRAVSPEQGLKLAKEYSYKEADKDVKIPNTTPELPKATTISKQDLVDKIAELSVSKLCEDHDMLEKVNIPQANCRDIVKQYIPACNQDRLNELDKMIKENPKFNDVKNLNVDYQVISYKYCLVEHTRNSKTPAK